MTTLPPGRIEMIAPDDLQIDPQPQRPFDQAHADSIAAKWDPTLVGCLQVSRRPDGNYVVDGQHRRAAAVKIGQGNVPLPCYVVEGLTVHDEAHRFVGINAKVKRPRPADTFRIKVVAGDPHAVAIDQILNVAGLKAGLASSDGSVAAIAALESVYYGVGTTHVGIAHPDLLMDTLGVLAGAWGKNHTAYSATMLRAVGTLLGQHGRAIDQRRLINTLAKAGTPVQLIGRARTLSDAMRVSATRGAIQVILDIYNHGLRKGRINTEAC